MPEACFRHDADGPHVSTLSGGANRLKHGRRTAYPMDAIARRRARFAEREQRLGLSNDLLPRRTTCWSSVRANAGATLIRYRHVVGRRLDQI